MKMRLEDRMRKRLSGSSRLSSPPSEPRGAAYSGQAGWTSQSGFPGNPYSTVQPDSGSALKPEAFGAPLVYAGGYDDTSAVQACITAALATNSIVELSRVYNVDHISGTGRLLMKGHGGNDGAGGLVTGLLVTQGSADGLAIASGAGSRYKDFGVKCNVATPTAGALVRFTGTGGGDFFRARDVDIINCYDGLRVEDGCYYKIQGVDVFDPVNYGMFFSTVAGERADHGDQTVQGCTISGMFVASRNGAAAVRWESGGGLRFLNNKINGAEQPFQASVGKFVRGVDIAVIDGTNTSDFLITGNSIENTTNAAVQVRQQGPSNTSTLKNIQVVGNEFGGVAYGAVAQANVAGDFAGFIVDGNTFLGVGFSAIVAQNVAGVTVGPNVHGSSGSTGVVYIDSGCSDYKVAPQTVSGDGLLYTDIPINSNRNAHGPYAQITRTYDREIPTCTSTSTYVTLYRFAFPQHSAGQIEVGIGANINGVGNAAYYTKQFYSRATGAVTLSNIVAPATAGNTFDVLLDTAAVSGEVQVKVRLNSVTGGTDLTGGGVTVNVTGPLWTAKKGA